MTGASAYPGRMWRYLRAMFPIPSRLGFSALLYMAVALFVSSVHDGEGPVPSWATALGVWNVFATLLILRLMDELKDRDIDARLFPERPLPAGLVRESDIRWSVVVVGAAFLAANLVTLQTTVAAGAVLAFAFLMFRHFFARSRLQASLPLTLVTHQPIIPLILLHAVVVGAVSIGRAPDELRWHLVLPLVLLLWMPFLGWEICRKIRAPEQETEYVTYSRLLGVRGSVLLAAIVQGLSIAAGAYLYLALELSTTYVVVLIASAAFVAWGHVRFVCRPVAERAVLMRFSQVLLIVLAALQVLEFGVLR